MDQRDARTRSRYRLASGARLLDAHRICVGRRVGSACRCGSAQSVERKALWLARRHRSRHHYERRLVLRRFRAGRTGDPTPWERQPAARLQSRAHLRHRSLTVGESAGDLCELSPSDRAGVRRGRPAWRRRPHSRRFDERKSVQAALGNRRHQQPGVGAPAGDDEFPIVGSDGRLARRHAVHCQLAQADTARW